MIIPFYLPDFASFNKEEIHQNAFYMPDDQYVSGKFRQSDEIERILKALQGVHHFQYKIINNEEIEIY